MPSINSATQVILKMLPLTEMENTFVVKFKLNTDGTLTIIGYNCSFKFIAFF
jgi:hypothetical protein